MNTTPKIQWTLQVSHEELNLIRRGLNLAGGNGANLANKLSKQIQEVRKTFVAAIDASLAVEKEETTD